MHQVFPRPLCPTALQSGDAVKQLQAILVAAHNSSQAQVACRPQKAPLGEMLRDKMFLFWVDFTFTAGCSRNQQVALLVPRQCKLPLRDNIGEG